MERLSELYNEVLKPKKSYLGQCDLLRAKSEENELFWHDMMKNKKSISFKTLIDNVNFKSMLDDDDEKPKDYINDALRSDPETSAYISNWGKVECMFFYTAGFEFIFV